MNTTPNHEREANKVPGTPASIPVIPTEEGSLGRYDQTAEASTRSSSVPGGLRPRDPSSVGMTGMLAVAWAPIGRSDLVHTRQAIGRALTTSILALALAGNIVAPGSAEPIWLDEPIQQWNQPGMAVPTVSSSETEPGRDQRCTGDARSAETFMDAAVADAGWSLFNAYESGWGTTMISGLSGHDGMCRPTGYHAFVFVDGLFAGTLAPLASVSRTDGALTRDARIEANGRIGAVFVRYADSDPLCCPSLPSVAVSYHVERHSAGPVLLVDRMTQIPRQ